MTFKYAISAMIIALFVGPQANSPPTEISTKEAIEKGFAIINNRERKNVVSDLYSLSREYSPREYYNDGKPKSEDREKRTITGRPKLDKLDIDYLYNSFPKKYEFSFDETPRTDIINGINCTLINFRPKPHLSTNRIADEFMNRTSGVICIDLDDFHIIQIKGAAIRKFDFKYWILFIPIGVDVYKFTFSIDYEIFNDMVIEKHLEGVADYEIYNRSVEYRVWDLNNHRMRK